MHETLSLVLRSTAIGLTLVLALAGMGLSGRGRKAFLPMLLCLAAYLVRSAPDLAYAPPTPWLLLLSVGALLFPVSFWWLAHNVFEDRADVPWMAWVAAPVMVGAGLWCVDALPGGPVALTLQKAVAAGFVIAALWRFWSTAGGDLVRGRRRLRGWLLGYAGLHGLVVLAVELLLQGLAPAPWVDTLNVAAITLALAVTAALVLRFDARAADMLFGNVPDAEALPAAAAARPPPDAAAERPWLEHLQRLMAVDALYRDPELSLPALAQRLGLPEYRLRELIHDRLGYRNFPAYVNDYRLQEVERKLVDPAFDRRPILTLALEAGFGSIGPFNRGFRERHGMTPTQFRERRAVVGATT